MDTPPLDAAAHRKLAVDLFNATWDLLDKMERSADEDAALLLSAHTSRWHWAEVARLGGASGPKQANVGDWQLSRVYAVLGEGRLARFFGERSLESYERDPSMGAFFGGFSHEALARAFKALGDAERQAQHLEAARALAAEVEDEKSRIWLEQNLEDLS